MNTLAFAPMLLETLKREAAQWYPHEMCGILIGRDQPGRNGEWRLVERIERVDNIAPSKAIRFEIDPKEILKWERVASAAGQTILGFYHSHPDSPARPSATDRHAAWPIYSYVIARVDKGVCTDVTSWLLRDGASDYEQESIVDMTTVDPEAD